MKATPFVSAAGLIAMLLSPVACVTEAAIKDLCSDDASCTSDAACPQEPPNQGVRCDLDEGAECFYCTEGDRIDASHYECIDNTPNNNDDTRRWNRLANSDCK
jgi:hypothetical protein